KSMLTGSQAKRDEADQAFRAAEVEVRTRGQLHEKDQELLASHRAQVPGLEALVVNARDYFERFNRLASTGDIPVQPTGMHSPNWRRCAATSPPPNGRCWPAACS